MKGAIVKCLEEVVKSTGGPEVWTQVLRDMELDEFTVFSAMGDVPDPIVLGLVEYSAKNLGIPLEAAFDAFGIHWSTVYAPRVYEMYFEQSKSARDFLLSMADVHRMVTRRIAQARPPRFEYREEGEDRMTMTYDSSRGLVALMPGLVRGVAQYYEEELEVRLEGQDVHIRFLSKASRRTHPLTDGLKTRPPV